MKCPKCSQELGPRKIGGGTSVVCGSRYLFPGERVQCYRCEKMFNGHPDWPKVDSPEIFIIANESGLITICGECAGPEMSKWPNGMPDRRLFRKESST